ncbi:MAG: iron-sulfur cluster carrier protein ApbC [Cardiobacteriaceae bacterium]|nr:iron-sulfur cluster carrier protein ApbC [Cardiobacteriaceae bacterium]
MNDIQTLIQDWHDPVLGLKPFAKQKITFADGILTLVTGFPCTLEHTRLEAAVRALLAEHGIAVKKIRFQVNIKAHAVQAGLKPLPGVKNIIAVASGKGGVGKSTLSVNLAIALSQQGANVGLLDADLYGPSQAMMLGGATAPDTLDGKTIQPVWRHGLQTLSIGDLVTEDTAMIWRGPMVTQTLMQLLSECQWHELDYLVIDLPPGTGDTQLTLAQQIPVAGAVIVTTPQEIALLDAKKAKTMFDKVSIPVLGLVENMSHYRCPNCGHEAHIFGHDGGKALAARYQLPLLGQIPLDPGIRAQADQGNPTAAADPHGELARLYQTIAARTAAQLASRQKSFTQAFPKIVVERG